MQRRYVSFALAQNWSMHVKYASRHVLYPSSKVPTMVVGVVVAARAGRAVFGFMLFCLFCARGVAAVREMVVARAVRFVVDVRDCVWAGARLPEVVGRVSVRRDVVRLLTDVGWVAWREIILFCAVREIVFSSRTAPLATPTTTKNVAISVQTFLIR